MSITFITIMLLMIAIPAFAAETETGTPQIQFNTNFNANDAIKTIFNWIIAIIGLAGVGIGGFHIVMGQINQDTKERNGGIITLFVSLAAGGLMILLLNMILI